MTAPRLTRAEIDATIEIAAVDEKGAVRRVSISAEYPLTLYVDRRELITLMTLGQMPEALAIGYLRNQRLIEKLADIESVTVDWEVAAAAVKTKSGLREFDSEKRTVTTGCGQGTIFGDLMDEVDSLRVSREFSLSRATLYDLLDQIRRRDTVYKSSGAVHGCALSALIKEGGGGGIAAEEKTEVLIFVEDVGRHNAVDAIAGWMWLNDVGGGDKIFYTTGRLTSEMVIKCAQMGIPYLISRSGITRMGFEVANQTGLTVIGRAVGKHYLVFSGAEHFAG